MSPHRGTEAGTTRDPANVTASTSLHVDAARRPSSSDQPSLRECVHVAVRRYLADLGEARPEDIYALVLQEVEPALLLEVLRHCHGNQSRCAEALGINRTTLRKKLRAYGLE